MACTLDRFKLSLDSNSFLELDRRDFLLLESKFLKTFFALEALLGVR